MSTPILMPAFSPTMESGKLTKWLVSEGEEVRAGELIAEIETDKATMELEAAEDGLVEKILIEVSGKEIAVNTPIALLRGKHEDTQISIQPDEIDKKKYHQEIGNTDLKIKSQKKLTSEDTSVTLLTTSKNGLAISPFAKNLAEEHKISLTNLIGTGPNGRIIKRDILEYLNAATNLSTDKNNQIETKSNQSTDARAEQVSSHLCVMPTISGEMKTVGITDREVFATYDESSFELIPHDNMRRTLADRLTISKSTIPHFYLSIDCELDQLVAARERLNEAAPRDGAGQFKLSVNDFIIKAMALALQFVPNANSSWSTKGILRHKSSDISVAVAVDGGLYTPVVRHAELKTLSEISNEVKDLAHKARAGKLAPLEYLGGVTTISNLGMFGIKKFDAVINPPQASILAVGKAEKRPIVRENKISISTLLTVTLSCDHRVIDGAVGAELLHAFKGFIEDPVTMLV